MSLEQVAREVGRSLGYVVSVLHRHPDGARIRDMRRKSRGLSEIAKMPAIRRRIVRMYRQGEAMAEISSRLQVSRAIVSRSVHNHREGDRVKQVAMEARKRREAEKRWARDKKMVDAYLGGFTTREIARKVGLSPSGDSAILRRQPEWRYIKQSALEARKRLRRR